MHKSPVCTCGDLLKFVRDLSVPITVRNQTDFELHINKEITAKLSFCPICGGLSESKISRCICRALSEWAALPQSCVDFDPVFDEYHLVTTELSKIILRFCPSCGGCLPTSKRSIFFTKPSEEHIDSFKTRLHNARTISDVVGTLGIPDGVFDGLEANEAEMQIYNIKRSIRTIRYTQLSETFDLIAQESQNGELTIFFLGKVSLPKPGKA